MTTLPSNATKTRRNIADIGPAERVSGAFSIMNAQIGKTRTDKPYLRCILRDKTGEMPGRMWSVEESLLNRMPSEGFVYIEGETQAYQGEMQCIIHVLDPIEPTPEQMMDLLPSSKRDPAEMFAELTGVLATIKHPAIKALADLYLADEHLMDALRRCPAAKSMHHAYLGGLLEHTLTLCRLADAVCPFYPKISRDLVIMGLFLHDLGKTREIKFDTGFSYTDRGELIGHIVEGAIMLHDKAQTLMREQGIRLPAGALTVLQHIILSHHGEPEFGAAKFPSTPEAILVSMLDNLDAKTVMSLAVARPDRTANVNLQGNFTDRQWALNNTKLFRPDPLA
ncbi:MAG: HD domain-containing protein [Planctomycetota bacterium]|nr:HD domain-containing protein [Planctomycetota bacterium]